MYGTFESHIQAKIGSEITAGQTGDGKAYCYFRVVVDRKPQTDANGEKKEKDPIWLKLSASGAMASYLTQRAKMGMWIDCWATGLPSQTKKEKEGVKTVYNDMTFYIQPGRLQLIGYTTFEKPVRKNTASDVSGEVASVATPQPVATNPEDDYADIPSADETEGSGNYLPF